MRNRSVTNRRDAVFRALADPTRRAVLDLLRQGHQPAGQIASAFPVSRPAISKHLRLLRRARLVRAHRIGRHRYYRLDPAPLRSVDHWLNDYRLFWSNKLADLKSFLESSKPARSAARQKHPKRPKETSHDRT